MPVVVPAAQAVVAEDDGVVPLGGEPAAHVLDDDGVALEAKRCRDGPHRLLVVGRADQDGRMGRAAQEGQVDVGREPDAVLHRDHDRLQRGRDRRRRFLGGTDHRPREEGEEQRQDRERPADETNAGPESSRTRHSATQGESDRGLDFHRDASKACSGWCHARRTRLAGSLPRPGARFHVGTWTVSGAGHSGTDTAIEQAIQTTPSSRPSRSIHDFSGRHRPDSASNSQIAATV